MDLEKIKFEQEHIDRKFRSSRDLGTIYKAMLNVEYQKNFEVGQVIVLRQVSSGKLVENKAGIPQKYIIANKLAGVLCLCRRIGINGKPGKGIEIIADYDPKHYVFEEDPDIADAILLGLDYDPLEMPKKIGKARQKAKKYNSGKELKAHVKDKVGTTNDVAKIMSFMEDMVILSPTNSWDIWRIKEEANKETIKIYEVDADANKVWAMVGNKKERIDGWALTSNYGYVYYSEEPKTVKEELEKAK